MPIALATTCSCWQEGLRFKVTNKSYRLINYVSSSELNCYLFLKHPQRAFTREELLQEIWETEYYGETRTVDMHIRTLRQKLGACGAYIETVRNVGYRLGGQT